MRNWIVVVLILTSAVGQLFGQERWVTTIGGTSRDEGLAIVALSDGGCMMVGTTESDDGDVVGLNSGIIDIVVCRLDSRGNVVWKQLYGGSQWDLAYAVAQTNNGGFIVVGETNSEDGEFRENAANGSMNMFVMNLNEQGEVQWTTTVGGSGSDGALAVITTADNHIVVAGYTESNDGDVDGANKGGASGLIIKLDEQGNVVWKNVIGGSSDDIITSISATRDGGYVATGRTQSNDGYFEGLSKGEDDIFVVKCDSSGGFTWAKTFGGTQADVGTAVMASPDGGIVVTGYTDSDNDDVAGLGNGGRDMIVIKLDEQGDVQWLKLFGGSGADESLTLLRAQSGEIVLAGFSNSDDGDFLAMNKGGRDIAILTLRDDGSVQWKKLHGGSRSDRSFSLSLCSDNGFILTGSTQSNDGDFEGMGKGSTDAFIMKLDANGDLYTTTSVRGIHHAFQGLEIAPNPVTSDATIAFSVPTPSRICVQIIDGLGQVVATVIDGVAEGGRHQRTMGVSGLVTGRYTVRLTAGGAATCTFMVVL